MRKSILNFLIANFIFLLASCSYNGNDFWVNSKDKVKVSVTLFEVSHNAITRLGLDVFPTALNSGSDTLFNQKISKIMSPKESLSFLNKLNSFSGTKVLSSISCISVDGRKKKVRNVEKVSSGKNADIFECEYFLEATPYIAKDCKSITLDVIVISHFLNKFDDSTNPILVIGEMSAEIVDKNTAILATYVPYEKGRAIINKDSVNHTKAPCVLILLKAELIQ